MPSTEEAFTSSILYYPSLFATLSEPSVEDGAQHSSCTEEETEVQGGQKSLMVMQQETVSQDWSSVPARPALAGEHVSTVSRTLPLASPEPETRGHR